MPSGAKKRKAAKKKREQQANNNSNNSSSLDDSSPRGSEDPRSQDERESDSGEVGSPLSQDHHNDQHPFNEENQESEKTNSSSLASECKPNDGVIEDAEGSQKIGVGDDTIVIIEKELNPEQYMESKDVNVEHVQSAKEAHDGYDKSSSSSSSDDEPQVLDKKWKEEALNSASDNVQKENEEKLLRESNDVLSRLVPEKNKDNLFPLLDENVGSSTNMVSSTVNGNEDKALPLSGAHSAETSMYAENIKDSGILSVNVVGNESRTLTSSGAYTSETSNDADKAKDMRLLSILKPSLSYLQLHKYRREPPG
ncbi:hypothetical protein GH714_043091 [Hevea brasiliensis]|uniref:Uncharacterized protein n=1 Tax=Hevea brasiliensis TaxID=3981 RepID=A0A6A6K1Z8_HEVBR|nr:hypothetical protein GH714_043091 [Hevea brasiliensis]